MKNSQKLNHNVKVLSKKRDELEDEDEAEHLNEPSNTKKRARVSIGNLPEPPSSSDTLDNDCLGNVLEFVGKKCYSVFGRVNKRCHEMFCSKGLPKVTYLFGYGPIHLIQQQPEEWYLSGFSHGVLYYNRRDILDWLLASESDKVYYKLKCFCRDAIKESRLDILCEVFQRANERQLEYLRYCDDVIDLCVKAAIYGKLECLKFLRENECKCDKFTWYCAKRYEHKNILEYLQNNGCPTE